MSSLFGESSPVYILRYNATVKALKEYGNVQKVIDFGCNDFSFVLRLKNFPGLREIAAVDIDRKLINQLRHKVDPLAFDFIIRRDQSLTINVFCGSICEKDDRLVNYDAVTAIEVIEHLEDDVLKAFPEVIFGFIQPKIAIFTTPNADFNVLFDDFKGFRHWDHKFEWSRLEFKEWCDSITNRYPSYKVEIDGIGKGPQGSEHLGCCSQMAIFTHLKPTNNILPDTGQHSCYELVSSCVYPGKEGSVADEIYNSALYYIHNLSQHEDYGSIEDEGNEQSIEIPLKRLLDFRGLAKLCAEQDTLRDILLCHGQEVYVNNDNVEVVKYIPFSGSDSEEYYEDDECVDESNVHESNVLMEIENWD